MTQCRSSSLLERFQVFESPPRIEPFTKEWHKCCHKQQEILIKDKMFKTIEEQGIRKISL